VNRLLRNFL